MKVLILFSSNKIGGAERSLSRMAAMPSDVNYLLGCFDDYGIWNKWANELGLKSLAFGSNTLMAVIRVLLLIRSYNIDVVYVCGLRLSIYLRFILFLSPHVILVHGVRWNPNSKSLLDKAFRILEKYTAKLDYYWITNSEAARETLVDLCNIPEARTLNIYNGIEISQRQKRNQHETYLNVITVANVSPRKGHKEFLEVIKKVQKIAHKVRFIFVGDDYMDGEVKKEVARLGLSQIVSIEGFKENVSEYLSKSDIIDIFG